eukprot:gnl/MRDRNA2_/MRDRNA2_131764_c0_seq1.p1 gnl/MRDRNA2_/MRDRNA2_131764_c0~~gnl/MRDRNA2_/MRDRNA2_131764_c0_seq1.p1  ORF type:complete len:299 (-),score=26.23 gnl/MRDRNA2_/MRDRNA2_131764_c0_seq1:107-1003(-)
MGTCPSRAKFSLQSEVPLVASKMAEDVRQYILHSLPDDVNELAKFGFERCVDHKKCLGHQYMEGYFHAIYNFAHDNVPSMHPRRGIELSRRPAPLELLAFCEATRRENCASFNELARALAMARNAKSLENAILQARHFADVSVQLHWGGEVPASHANWHVDGPNSTLHLALSLHGERTLLAKREIPRAKVQRGADGTRTTQGLEPDCMLQSEGSVYLSAPCCYPHAVQYPEASWENRVVAVQCRVLLEDSAFERIDMDSMGCTMQTVMSHLAHMHFRLPSLEAVQEVNAELEATRYRD